MKPSFRCPSCDARFRADEKHVGRRVRCPNAECGQTVLLTLEPTDAAPSSTAQKARPVAEQKPVQKPASPARTTIRSEEKEVSDSAPPVRSAASKANSSSRSRTGDRKTSKTHYESQSPLKPLFTGLIATTLVGGAILAGYSFLTKPAETPDIVAQTDAASEQSQPAAATATASTNEASSASANINGAPGTSLALGAAQTTSVVAGATLRQNAERQQKLEEKVIPFLAKHCADCHNATEQEGGIALHDLESVDQLLKDRKKWERVYRMINAGAMPPASYDPKPEEPVRKEVVDALYDELYNFDCSLLHHAGRSTLHRLNRAEYNNTIRDLFGVKLTPADKFPQDDVGEGFDNIGDVLSLPPLLMEKYLDAAEEVAAAVIDTRDFSKGSTQKFEATQFKSTLDGSINEQGFYVLHTRGTVSITYDGVADGTYKVRIEAAQTEAGPDPSKMELLIDDKPVKEFEVNGHRKPVVVEHDVQIAGGKRTIGVAFTNDFYDEKAPENRRDRNLGIKFVEIIGPEGGGAPQWHETHRRFVTAVPSESVSVKSAAATVLRPMLYRAFRRPVSDAEVDRFSSLVEQTVTQHKETYEYGLFIAVQAMLVSPEFLFRKEADPEANQTERVLNEYEVAARLSYFLWSSMPDDQLFQLAENKRLLDRSVLREQIERMLRDEKSAALGQNFASQWLNLRNLADVRPNPEVFPEFDDALRSAMGQETLMLFNTIVREDRSVDEFLAADYTFVNERLAKHYGINGVTGDQYVKVSLQGTNRSGVLTHASILTLTSNPGRTSPVKRGKWILENILGDAPPPAPPGVPPLEESTKDVTGLSLRERLELHRKDPGCASCHKAMDPLGMGLENFDAVGRWREKDGEKPVDASGDLPSGDKFSGPAELMTIIRSRQEKFSRTLIERLLVYSLGRGLEYYDKCAVDQTMDLMKERGNRFSALVEGIVTSDAFLKKSLNRETNIGVAQ